MVTLTESVSTKHKNSKEYELNGEVKDNFSKELKIELMWASVLVLGFGHVFSFYGLYLAVTSAKWMTLVFCNCVY